MRLDQIDQEYGDEVEIQWRSFLLRPRIEERTVEAFTRYTESWSRPASIEPEAYFARPWSGEHEPPSHSVPAAIAGKLAATYGPETFQRFHHLLLTAYFTENRTISDAGVLADVAEAAGIDRVEWDERIRPDPHPLLQLVADDHNEAIQRGVSGVPAVVVADKYLIGGAVDVGEYRRVIDHVLNQPPESA